MEFSVGEYTIHSFHISDHLTQIHKPLFIYHMLLCTVKWGDFGLPGDFGQAVVCWKKVLIKSMWHDKNIQSNALYR